MRGAAGQEGFQVLLSCFEIEPRVVDVFFVFEVVCKEIPHRDAGCDKLCALELKAWRSAEGIPYGTHDFGTCDGVEGRQLSESVRRPLQSQRSSAIIALWRAGLQ
jgi:hypothetical protein